MQGELSRVVRSGVRQMAWECSSEVLDSRRLPRLSSPPCLIKSALHHLRELGDATKGSALRKRRHQEAKVGVRLATVTQDTVALTSLRSTRMERTIKGARLTPEAAAPLS